MFKISSIKNINIAISEFRLVQDCMKDRKIRKFAFCFCILSVFRGLGAGPEIVSWPALQRAEDFFKLFVFYL